MKKVIALVIVIVLVTSFALAGCTGASTQSSAPAESSAAVAETTTEATQQAAQDASSDGGTIKIGALLDYTGVVADLGAKFKAGIELALEEADYKVAGKTIELVDYDSASDPTKAVEGFKNITEKDGVKLVIGPLMGDAHLAIAPLAKEKDVIITSLVNGMYDTIELADNHYIQYPTTCEAQTEPFGKWIAEQGYKTMAIVACNMAGKIAFANGIKSGFESGGGEVVSEVFPEPGTDDYSSYIATLPQADCVLYALNGPAEVSKFVYQFQQSGRKDKLFTITQDADYTPEALAELGDVALGIEGEASYTWQLDNAANKTFVEGIMAKTGTLPSSSEQNAYTLTKVLLAALEKTNGDDSYEVMWPAITSLNMETPAGQLTFEPSGVAITDLYVTQAEKAEDGTIQLSAPIAIIPQIRDSRLTAE